MDTVLSYRRGISMSLSVVATTVVTGVISDKFKTPAKKSLNLTIARAILLLCSLYVSLRLYYFCEAVGHPAEGRMTDVSEDHTKAAAEEIAMPHGSPEQSKSDQENALVEYDDTELEAGPDTSQDVEASLSPGHTSMSKSDRVQKSREKIREIYFHLPAYANLLGVLWIIWWHSILIGDLCGDAVGTWLYPVKHKYVVGFLALFPALLVYYMVVILPLQLEFASKQRKRGQYWSEAGLSCFGQASVQLLISFALGLQYAQRSPDGQQV